MRAGALIVVCALGIPACAAAKGGGEAKRATMDYDTAVSQLKSARTWCDGAKALAKLGDRRALAPLLAAFEVPMEGASKVCLLDALEALGAKEAARDLLARGTTAPERRIALRLMGLFPDPAHLAPLEPAAADPDPLLRRAALRAIDLQRQTPAWEALLIRLLDSTDEATRGFAIDGLARHMNPTREKALRERLAGEPLPSLRESIERSLAPRRAE
ncbi:MAG: HEAT repeat domain-containing protein [Myxococcales bacterium]|nr:HEAT repeat domain-containing protein [Myxococcales bacterium]